MVMNDTYFHGNMECRGGQRVRGQNYTTLSMMWSTAMKVNEKNVASFASSDSPVDKEGYLLKKNDVKGYQRRWFVLKGNLLFYYEKKQDKEPAGMIILESYSVQASATEKHAFEISFDGQGTRTYIMVADNDEEMQSWMRAVSHASYEFLRGIVNDLQQQVNALTARSHVVESDKLPKPNDGKLPLLPKPKVKVENGVLVDVNEAPPVPPKKRSTIEISQSLDNTDSEDQPVRPHSSIPVIPFHPTQPHSNPIVITSSTGGQTLSPPGTLDRTPVLLPTVVQPQEREKLTDLDYDIPPPPVPDKGEQKGVVAQTFVNMPSSHTPSVVKSMAGPPTAHKNVYDLHQNFTEAMRELNNKRTDHNVVT